jgi:hypothetical protein
MPRLCNNNTIFYLDHSITELQLFNDFESSFEMNLSHRVGLNPPGEIYSPLGDVLGLASKLKTVDLTWEVLEGRGRQSNSPLCESTE